MRRAQPLPLVDAAPPCPDFIFRRAAHSASVTLRQAVDILAYFFTRSPSRAGVSRAQTRPQKAPNTQNYSNLYGLNTT